MPLKVCFAHDIVFDEDRFEDGCPLCDAGTKIVVLEKRITELETENFYLKKEE